MKKKTSKLQYTGLREGNAPVTGEFLADKPVTQKMFPFDDAIIIIIQYLRRHIQYVVAMKVRACKNRLRWVFCHIHLTMIVILCQNRNKTLLPRITLASQCREHVKNLHAAHWKLTLLPCIKQPSGEFGSKDAFANMCNSIFPSMGFAWSI